MFDWVHRMSGGTQEQGRALLYRKVKARFRMRESGFLKFPVGGH